MPILTPRSFSTKGLDSKMKASGNRKRHLNTNLARNQDAGPLNPRYRVQSQPKQLSISEKNQISYKSTVSKKCAQQLKRTLQKRKR